MYLWNNEPVPPETSSTTTGAHTWPRVRDIPAILAGVRVGGAGVILVGRHPWPVRRSGAALPAVADVLPTLDRLGVHPHH